MIVPNMRIYQLPVISSKTIPVETLPELINSETQDSNPIDIIHNQPLPNDIVLSTESEYKIEIDHMIKLLGAYCQENSITKIKETINSIHSLLNDKNKPLIKSWVQKLTSLHPLIDKAIKEDLKYFSTPYSEIIGTNTIMYYADTTSTDITFWSEKPIFLTNEVVWTDSVWSAPTYLRESIREKLPNYLVEYIMNSNYLTTKYLQQSLTYDSVRTTEDLTGREIAQQRPIEYNIAHGVALNNDSYHQQFRIFGEKSKSWCREDVKYLLSSSGFVVHFLFNYIEPLVTESVANNKLVEIKVEETFPNKNGNTLSNIAQNGQPIFNNNNIVNDDSIKPEEVKII